MKEFTWEAYNINDECIGGGSVYAIDRSNAEKQIEKQIEEEIDDWTESGYFTHKIINIVDKDYDLAISGLKSVGTNIMSESNWTVSEYAEAVKELCNKYGEERVKKDLGIK